MAITLGEVVTDSITGFVGVAIARTSFMHDCVRVAIQPKGLIENKLQSTEWFDEKRLLENDPNVVYPKNAFLGEIVTDSVSGIKGTATAYTTYIHSAPRICIQPKGSHEGKPIDSFDVDEVQLKEYKAPKTVSAEPRRTSGPGDVACRPSSAPRT